jgi:hypothetical protein
MRFLRLLEWNTTQEVVGAAITTAANNSVISTQSFRHLLIDWNLFVDSRPGTMSASFAPQTAARLDACCVRGYFTP